MKKKIIVFLLTVTCLVSSLGNTIWANTISRSIGGIQFTAYSSITATYGSAGTTAGNSNFYGYVSSTYISTNPNTGDSSTQRLSKSGSGSSGAVSFSPKKSTEKSTSIDSSHNAIYGGETWSGSTSASRL